MYNKGGRPRGSFYKLRGDLRHKREAGGPVLRREQSAPEKLAVLVAVDEACESKLPSGLAEQADWSSLTQAAKRQLEKRFHVPFETLKLWNKKRAALQAFVAKHRLGKHGLLPCGSRGSSKLPSRSLGKRLQDEEKRAEKLPLYPVYEKMRAWLNNERAHNQEVRKSHLLERFKFQMEYERDKQLVLEQHGSVHFRPATLERLREILATFEVVNPSNKQESWFIKTVLPSIGARLRGAQRLRDKPASLDETKAKLTWQTSDWFQDLVLRGTPEELSEFVAKPIEFAENRHKTAFVVMDQTAVWLKVRGEEKLVFSAEELTSRAKRKQASRAFKKAQTNAAREGRPELQGPGRHHRDERW